MRGMDGLGADFKHRPRDPRVKPTKGRTILPYKDRYFKFNIMDPSRYSL